MSNQNILLFTPGLDSFLANYFLEKQGIKYERYYVNLQTKYAANEVEFLKFFYGLDDYVTILHNYINAYNLENPDTYHVPNRNALLCTFLQGLTNTDHIFLNGVLDDNVSDNNERFYDVMGKLLTEINGKPVTVSSPLIKKEKSEWVKIFSNENDLANKLELISMTYSCFNEEWIGNDYVVYEYDEKNKSYNELDKTNGVGCMECVACFRKFCALTYANLFVPFKNLELIQFYKERKDLERSPNRYQTIKDYYDFNQIWREKYAQKEVKYFGEPIQDF